MKIKFLICLGLIVLLVFLIHIKTSDHNIYYLNLSIDKNSYSYENDVKNHLEKKGKLEKFISDFTSPDDRVTDLILTIEDNKSVMINNKKQTIQNALIKADLVTIFIGLNDINYKVSSSVTMDELYDYADSFLTDMDELLGLIREYCKEDIVMIGYYNSYGNYYDEYFNYINREAELICKDYGIEFISLFEVYDSDKHIDNILLDKQENKLISEKIIKVIDRKKFKGSTK